MNLEVYKHPCNSGTWSAIQNMFYLSGISRHVKRYRHQAYITWWLFVHATILRWSSLHKKVPAVNQGRVNIPRLLARGCIRNKERESFNKLRVCCISIREKLTKSMSAYRFSRPCLTTRCNIPQVHFYTFPTTKWNRYFLELKLLTDFHVTNRIFELKQITPFQVI
jgi:hypothetical protein